MKLKVVIPVFFALLILMPIIGVGVVWYTTVAENARKSEAAAERAEAEKKRWEEIRAEQKAAAEAREEAATQDAPLEFHDKLKTGG